MYLTIRQHDLFRTLLMGFEIPFRAYIAKTVTTAYGTDSAFESAMLFKNTLITPSSPQFLKNVLPKECRKGTLKTAYTKFVTATTSTDEIVTTDIDLPMVYGWCTKFGDICFDGEFYRFIFTLWII